MSTHPNVILMAELQPHGLSRKTMAAISAEAGISDDVDDSDIAIGAQKYHRLVMESDYHDNWQISAKEGSLVFFDLVTYGYGDTVEWTKLEAQKNELEAWAKSMCERHHCDYRIVITANYW